MTEPKNAPKVGDKVYIMSLGYVSEGVVEEVRQITMTVYGIRSNEGHAYQELRKEDLFKTHKECERARR
jgi:hypothetical protein